MSGSYTGEGTLRPCSRALRGKRCKPDFFQAGQKTPRSVSGGLSSKKTESPKKKRGRSKKDNAAKENPAMPSRVSQPGCSLPANKNRKKGKAQLIVIEDGDDVPEENEPYFGNVVWAQLGGFRSYHAALVIKGSMVNLATADTTQSFVFWFSDSKVSAVEREKLLDFVAFFPKKRALCENKQTRSGILKAIEELKRRVHPGCQGLNETDLLQWAESGFPTGSSDGDLYRSGPAFSFPERIMERLNAIGADIRAKAAMKDKDIFNKFHEENAIEDVRQGIISIFDVCIGCADHDRIVTCQHPMFEGGLCSKCKVVLRETLFALSEDGTHSYCVVCGAGGKLFVCDTADCGRVFCIPCVAELGGEEVLEKVKDAQQWACFLCQPFSASSHGLLKPIPDWQKNLVSFFNLDYGIPMVPDLDYFKDHRPVRVLSLFDGIGTGLLALQRAGVMVEVYYASETDEHAVNISRANHGHCIIQLGDVANITRDKLAELAPIDLLIGGSPCNEFSLANPKRKGFDVQGSGALFFDFYRILRDLVTLNGTTHLFWMFENVASMCRVYRNVISRFLQCQPALWDAKHLSAQKRSRFFWGNIPGLYSTPEVSDALRHNVDLNSVLTTQCQRQSTVQCLRTITTQPNSLLQGPHQKTLPVSMAGSDDTLWLPELERLFGFPTHYTDVCNLPPSKRRALLGKSWSVQVVTEIFKPLALYFATNSSDDATHKDVAGSEVSNKNTDVGEFSIAMTPHSVPAPDDRNSVCDQGTVSNDDEDMFVTDEDDRNSVCDHSTVSNDDEDMFVTNEDTVVPVSSTDIASRDLVGNNTVPDESVDLTGSAAVCRQKSAMSCVTHLKDTDNYNSVNSDSTPPGFAACKLQGMTCSCSVILEKCSFTTTTNPAAPRRKVSKKQTASSSDNLIRSGHANVSQGKKKCPKTISKKSESKCCP